MKRVSRIVGATGALIALAIGHVAAQTARVEGGVRSLTGVDFYWETRLVPPVPPLDGALQMLTLCGTWTGAPGPSCGGADTVHRVMVDRSRKLYFGYDARVTVIKTDRKSTRLNSSHSQISY